MCLKYLILSFFIVEFHCATDFQLQQVLILSRHNVRTPLARNLENYTPKPWPKWKEKSGYLTAKGALLEGYMGEFFYSWLLENNLLNEDCPDGESFFVYSNNAQRTLASAKAFVDNAFPSCNITINHANGVDPIFNPVIHNTSLSFKIEATDQMQHLLKSFHFNQSYEHLEDILDYKQSKSCLMENRCDFKTDKNKIFVQVGAKPNLVGPLKISKSVIESFIMANYEGFPESEVAWGTLKTTDEWNSILDLTKGYHSIIFNTTLVAKDIASPFIKFIKEILIEKEYKTSLIMAHDANIYTLLRSLDIKPYNLEKQFEIIPAGGKIVIQKWLQDNSGTFHLKIDYVYQGTDDMRDGKKLSMDNPPEFTLLELNSCNVDENGLCLWDEFVKLLEDLVGNQ